MKVVDDDGIELGEISRISLKPSDVVVFDYKEQKVSTQSLKEIYDKVSSYFPNNKVIFVSNGVELKIIEGGKDNE